MSPTLRHARPHLDLDVVRDHRVPTAARAYAWSLLALAVALIVVLVATGHELPAPGPLLLLALPLALCMNRYLLFPDELGVTADAAVLFAAMVVFRGESPWLGPLVLALLVGLLDARHWGARAWTRMAYNSGSTALVTAVGVSVNLSLTHELGRSWSGTALAAAGAALPYVAVETALGIGLVSLLGERPAAAAHHQLPLNAIAVPLSLFGVTVGLAALDVGWWCAVALLPVALAPELWFVVVPRRLRRAPTTLLVSAVPVLAVALSSGAAWATGAAFVALGLLAAAESRRLRGTPLPALAALPGVALLVVPAPDARGPAAVCLVVVAASSLGWVQDDARSVPLSALPWLVPSACGAWFAARLWQDTGRVGPLVFVAATTVSLVASAACGAPAWGSRGLGRWSAQHLGRGLRCGLVAAGSVAILATLFGVLPIAGVALEVVVAMGMATTRQWRFAPRPRARDATALVVSALASTVLLSTASGGLAVVVTVATLLAVVGITWPSTRFASRAAELAPEMPAP